MLGGDPPVSQRELILDRQRDVVSAVMRALRRAYPQRLNPQNQTAITMMLFGMINWTFTWLRPDGPMSYAAFADEVIGMLERGLACLTSRCGKGRKGPNAMVPVRSCSMRVRGTQCLELIYQYVIRYE
jgi:hypothetical protein